MSILPRLDVLLYAHDGRGLGHASRTIAIGMALRRLYPSFRVLFVSGCRFSQELIDRAPLDWLKLPSYETEVRDGKSKGVTGLSNFEDDELGKLRAEQLRQIIQTYRPRIVLTDHSPQGKHRELLPSLTENKGMATTWILGMRAVIGEVGQIQSQFAGEVYSKFYTSVLWYGDSTILGDVHTRAIRQRYNSEPLECGYVSRVAELMHYQDTTQGDRLTGTIAIPWFGEKTPHFLDCLYTMLVGENKKNTIWKLYLDATHEHSAKYHSLFNSLANCSVHPPGREYISSLLCSERAIIYGGYNSLMDVLSLAVPAVVILREMQDNEQQQHLDALLRSAAETLVTIPESCNLTLLQDALTALPVKENMAQPPVNLQGAASAANFIAGNIISFARNNAIS